MMVINNCHAHILYMLIYVNIFKKDILCWYFLKGKISKIEAAFLMIIAK